MAKKQRGSSAVSPGTPPPSPACLIFFWGGGVFVNFNCMTSISDPKNSTVLPGSNIPGSPYNIMISGFLLPLTKPDYINCISCENHDKRCYLSRGRTILMNPGLSLKKLSNYPVVTILHLQTLNISLQT